MQSKHYKPTSVTTTLPKLKKKRKLTGVTFPAILTPDTGIHVVKQLTGDRYRIWFHVGTKKRYVSLPKGTTMDEARTRRDRLYENLKREYGARRRTPREADTRKAY